MQLVLLITKCSKITVLITEFNPMKEVKSVTLITEFFQTALSVKLSI